MEKIFSREEYLTFMSILQLLKDKCAFLDMKDGKICQFSDARNFIFNIDMSNFMSGVSLSMFNIQHKTNLLNPFKSDNSEKIILSDSEDKKITKYSFKDKFTKVEFYKPNEKFIKNKFENFDILLKNNISIDLNKPIYSKTLKRIIVSRILSYQKSFGDECQNVLFKFNNNNISLSMFAGDKEQQTVTTIFEDDTCNSKLVGSSSFNVSLFNINTESIDIEIFKSQKTENLVLKVFCNIGDAIRVPVEIYSPARFIFEEDEDN